MTDQVGLQETTGRAAKPRYISNSGILAMSTEWQQAKPSRNMRATENWSFSVTDTTPIQYLEECAEIATDIHYMGG
jgi:hypothetical protein